MSNHPLRDVIQDRLIGILRRPEAAKKKPSNAALYVAYIFFNFVFAFLDMITAITVAVMTKNALYGVLTFMAGFVPTFMHEFLFVRAYATWWQRFISICGAVLGIVSTVLIGMIAGIVNVFDISKTIDPQYMEIGVIVSLVLISGIHAVLTMVYFYIDDGIRSTHKRQEAVAYHERQKQHLEDAKDIVKSVKEINQEIETFIVAGEENLLSEAFKNVSGNDLIQKEDSPAGIPADPMMPFLERKQAVMPPLPELDGTGK